MINYINANKEVYKFKIIQAQKIDLYFLSLSFCSKLLRKKILQTKSKTLLRIYINFISL